MGWFDKFKMPDHKWFDAGMLDGDLRSGLSEFGLSLLKADRRDRWYLATLESEPSVGHFATDDKFQWDVLKKHMNLTNSVYQEVYDLPKLKPAGAAAFKEGLAFFVMGKTSDGRRHAGLMAPRS